MSFKKNSALKLDMFEKQPKLTDFCEELSRFRSGTDILVNGCDSIDDNLFVGYKNGKIYFSNISHSCPRCGSHSTVKNGDYKRELIILGKGKQKCIVQVYKCNKCGKVFYSDLSSFVKPNCNITLPVIEIVEKLFSINGNSIIQIRETLKEAHNVDISIQSIENIILAHESQEKYDNWSYSGYYLFDSLWSRINSVWKYTLALFDIKLNTIVSFKLVESEDIKTIKDFLDESLTNQNKKAITTDLKTEYGRAIDKIYIIHHFCNFHSKQKINRDIYDYIKLNKPSSEEKNKINEVKESIFNIMDAENYETAKKERKYLLSLHEKGNTLLHKLIRKFTIPYFRKLTNHIKNKNIESTTNKIENIFGKLMPPHLKRRMRSNKGFEKRMELRLEYWNQRNIKI